MIFMPQMQYNAPGLTPRTDATDTPDPFDDGT